MAGSLPNLGRVNVLRRAARGDSQAMRAIAKMAMPEYREKYQELDRELEHHRSETWDVEEMREWALDPETSVDPETFVAAWGELMNKVLTITSSTAPVLAGDERESQVFEQRLRQAAYDLFILVNNPVIRYTIIAGFEPRFRAEVDEYLTRIGRETWGSARALVQDELEAGNYPPETQQVLRNVAKNIQAADD